MATAYPLPDELKTKQLLELLFDGLDVEPGSACSFPTAGRPWRCAVRT
jgi:hypothetical protein